MRRATANGSCSSRIASRTSASAPAIREPSRIVKAAIALGHHITVFPLLVPDESWDEAYSDLPREAELWVGGGAAGLMTLMQMHGVGL